MILKSYKSFIENKVNNVEGSLITIEDMVSCIKSGKLIYVNSVKNYPNIDKTKGLLPLDVDNDGLITVSIDNKEYTVDIKNVIEIEN
jgi:hypothetical protein